jgi:hypothetical protein
MPGSRLAVPAAVSLVLALVFGCGKRDELGVRRVSPESARGDATVSGRVKLVGAAPVMQPIKNQPCHDGAKSIEDETVVVDSDGGLQNVFVYLVGGPMVNGATLSPATLDQVDCRYTPHVIGVVTHQPLVVKSSDPTYHNTHYTPKRNPADNFGLRQAGHQKTVRFASAEIFHVRCDVHPWMSAYIGVFDNELFSISGERGSFSIESVPAGTYALVAWHELYGEQRREITVSSGQAIEIDIEFVVP